MTIDLIPDVALIEIFDFYMAESLDRLDYSFFRFNLNKETWIVLAHVCQKWRDIVFGSPYRLNVRLFFKARRSVRAMLDTWPPFLIDIWVSDLIEWEVDNIVAALEHTDRIHKIQLWHGSSFNIEQVLAAMQKTFPSLTELALGFSGEWETPVVPDSFLSGSAPFLRSLRLRRIQFPLPLLRNILLSTTNLVELRIWRIPDSGFISPEDMVVCLSGLNRLEEFELGFRFPRIWRGRRLPPSTCCVLPVLTSLRFNGSHEYLERLISPIDSPLLDNLGVTVFHQPGFATPQLTQFVDRTPKLKALREAHIFFDSSEVFVSLPWTLHRGLHFRITDAWSDQISVMARLYTSSFLLTLNPLMKRLYIFNSGTPFLYRPDNVGSNQWPDLLGPFTTVKDLYLSRGFSQDIVSVLHGIIGEGTVEVLPSLQNFFLEGESPSGPVEEAIGQFVAARCLSGRPIAVSRWEKLRDSVRDPWWRLED